DPRPAPMEGLDPNDYLPHSAIASIAQGAVGRGVHLTVMLDSCFSGNAADMIHDVKDYPATGPAAATDASASPGAAPSPVEDAVELVRSAKLGLTRMIANWEAEHLGLSRADSWDPQHMEEMLFQLDVRYASAIARLWKEFLLPRVQTAMQMVQS